MDSDIRTIREVDQCMTLAEKTAYRHGSDGKFPGFGVAEASRFRLNGIYRWIER